MSFSLIVPVAADSQLFHKQIPSAFSLDKEGYSLCLRSILGLNLDQFDSIYFTILSSHDKQFCISDLLKLQFKRLGLDKAEVVILEKGTNSQSETIYETIRQKKISGAIFIKDADCFFEGEVIPHNGVAIYPLENLQRVNPQHKSYVVVDDNFYITNIIEKKIVSHYFSAGGYCFDDADMFCKEYLEFKNKSGLYLSHIIYHMLLSNNIFRPFIVKNYIDFEI